MPNIHKIQHVSTDELRSMLSIYRPRGLFLCREGKWWIAVDNTTGEAWTEEFRWLYEN